MIVRRPDAGPFVRNPAKCKRPLDNDEAFLLALSESRDEVGGNRPLDVPPELHLQLLKHFDLVS
jgi:hypothetical protein